MAAQKVVVLRYGATVHHDLWDYDNASPPALVTITRHGRRIAAVLQANKSGMVFVLETGRELWSAPLPAGAKATPMSYRTASGHQFVAVAVGGGGALGPRRSRRRVPAEKLLPHGLFPLALLQATAT